ncbi:MAG: sporulation integral membrane protein YtvI [Lachnospiraceae bacterium]|nr:sporulation integral membrane protein YtvI [Lachnospiraceae bacterium]MBO7340684.1 sporulation integral membrane protein YtvI [Lachnospiraceae bacterium]MBP5264187.1 sporulation integral membrane protein YtvI [Lachnospiraceae bacterium]
MKKYCKAVVNIVVFIVAVLLVVFLLPRLLAFFAPFVVGLVIAWMAGPPVKFFEEKMKIKRRAGSAFVIIAVIALIVLAIYGLGSILVKEGVGFAQSFPEMWEDVQKDLDEIAERMKNVYLSLPEAVRDRLDGSLTALENSAGDFLGKISNPTLTAVGNFAKYLPTLLIGVIMALLSAYFFVADRKNLNDWCTKHVPKVIQDRYELIRQSLVRAVGGYVKAQLKIEIWVYFVLVIGLWILKVRYVLLIAVGIAFLDFLPVFGTGTVMVPWAIIKIMGGDLKMGIGILITWGLGQLLRQIIQPKIVGDSIGLSPLPTLFLLYLGYQFGGVFGMIVAIPVGLILFSLYEGGVFDTTKDSVKLLVLGVNQFRRLTPEDLKEIREEEKAEEKMLEEAISEESEKNS